MPNPTALSSLFSTRGNSPFQWGGQQHQQMTPVSGQPWESMPLNPAGLVSTQAPPVSVPMASTGTAIPAPPAAQHPNLPQLYSNWWKGFQTWAQHDPWANSWWQGWGNWFQNWSQQTTGDTAGASTDNGLSVLPGPPQPNPQIPVSAESSVGSNASGGGPENPGMGQYIPTQSYMMTPAGQAGIRGLGSCGCGCGGGCGCSQPGGMGTLGDGTGLFGSGLFNGAGVAGSGLFEGGFDPSTWGPAEWAVLAIGGYVVWSVFFTTKAAVGYAASVPARTKRAARGVKSSFL